MSVVLITGCSSGFGLEFASAFARRGDTVIATMRDLARDAPLRERVAAEEFSNVTVKRLDVVDAANREAVVDDVLAEFGQIDVLINNAGIGQWAPVEESDHDRHREVFETNYFAIHEMMKLVLPGMRVRRSGRIVNISSVSGLYEAGYVGTYAASKHALDGLSATADVELSKFGIRVVLVMPGGFGTQVAERIRDHTYADVKGSAYGEQLAERFEQFANRLRSATDLTPVVETVIEAATAAEPRLRYRVGGRSLDDPILEALEEFHRGARARWLEG